jgi:hypothetical protein
MAPYLLAISLVLRCAARDYFAHLATEQTFKDEADVSLQAGGVALAAKTFDRSPHALSIRHRCRTLFADDAYFLQA